MHDDLLTKLKTSSHAATASKVNHQKSLLQNIQTAKHRANHHHHQETNQMKYLYVRSRLIRKIKHKHLTD